MDIKEKINTFPKSPGIYLMKDKDGKVIYVGKSKKLKERIKSYFVNSKNHSRKTQRLIKGIYDIEIITTDTELDALLLECKMIIKLRPMYNRLMRNPENYVYLKVDKDMDYPYLQVVKEIDDDKLYLGPYTLGKKLEDIKLIIEEAYKIRSCKKMTKCFNYDLDKCMGPCRDLISKERYKEIIENIAIDLQRDGSNILNILKEDLSNEISKLNFEKASEINNKIDKLKSLFNRQNMINDSIENNSILAWIKLDEEKYKIYTIKNAMLIKSEIMKNEEFKDLDKKKYFSNNVNNINSINESTKVLIDKFDIDYVNIIYSYIKYNNEIEYMLIK